MINMVNLQTFLTGLLITSTLTGLATEAVKNILNEYNKQYQANTLAGIVSLLLSLGIGVGYIVITSTTLTAQVVITLISLVFMSWLCAMVGYDKVVQTITQIKHTGKDDCDE